MRHKRAVDIITSLHGSVLFLVCDGYSDTDVLQQVSAKVNQGQELVSQGHTEEITQGAEFEGHERVSQRQGLAGEGHELVQEKVSQGHGVRCKGHEMVTDKVGQGQVLVFEGHTEVC